MSPLLPQLTSARAPLTHAVRVVNEFGEHASASIPAERALTVYVDKRELVTLMTLGAHPELLVLGFLRNQRLVAQASDIESITVDWEVGAAAVKTRHGITDIEARTASRVVTTGCGQGSVFGALMDDVDALVLPEARLSQAQLYAVVNAIRLQESTYKSSGSVHGCALFGIRQAPAGVDGALPQATTQAPTDEPAQAEVTLRLFVEDVGRHNAVDTIAGWLWMQGDDAALPGSFSLFYTTGRLTSEMVIKSAQMGVPIVVSRSGITQMGHEIATQIGLCAIGRATHRRFLCFSGAQRLQLQPALAGTRPPTAPTAPGVATD